MELDPLRVSDDLSLAPGTQLAITDGDQYIIVNLQYEDESGGSGPSGIVFHKPQLPHNALFEKDTKVEFSEDGVPVIQCAAVNADDGQQTSLDHEQALAVANLLNFHNQQSQSQLYALTSAGATITKDTVSISSSDSSRTQKAVPFPSTSAAAFECEFSEIKQEAFLPNTDISGESPQVSEIKKPVKTYSRKKTDKLEDSNSAAPSVSTQAPVPLQPLPVSTKSRVVFPSSSVSLDSLNRKRRRCFHDTVRVIPPSEFKMQLKDTSDIVVNKIDVAPPTKKEMHHLAYSGVGKYFSHPGRRIGSVPLSKMFFSRLTMTTEPKPTANSDSKLEPLDTDLRTPVTRELCGISSSSTLTSETTPSAPPAQVFTEAIARKTASSFESFCKGMHKQPRFDHLRKKNKLNQSPVEEPTESSCWKNSEELSAKTVSIVYGPGNGCEIADIRVHNDSVSLDDATQLYSEDGFIGFDNSRVLVKQENGDSVTSESNSQTNSDLDENATPNTSSIDILIAAAERENNNPPSGERNSSSFNLCTEGVVEVKQEDAATTEIYNANDGIEQLVILGPNGERYFADFTLWG